MKKRSKKKKVKRKKKAFKRVKKRNFRKKKNKKYKKRKKKLKFKKSKRRIKNKANSTILTTIRIGELNTSKAIRPTSTEKSITLSVVQAFFHLCFNVSFFIEY